MDGRSTLIIFNIKKHRLERDGYMKKKVQKRKYEQQASREIKYEKKKKAFFFVIFYVLVVEICCSVTEHENRML